MNRSSLLGAKLAVPLLALFMTAPLFGSGSFWFQIPNGAAAVGEEVSIPVFLHSESLDVLGWSFGLCHDPAVLTVNSVGVGEATDLALGGANPYFFVTEIEPESYSVALVLDSLPFTSIPPGTSEIIVGTYSHQLTLGESTVVTPCAKPGPPPTSLIVLAIDSSNVPASATPGTWFGGSAPFVRGDVNDDGAVNLGDGSSCSPNSSPGENRAPARSRRTSTTMGRSTSRIRSNYSASSFKEAVRPRPPSPIAGRFRINSSTSARARRAVGEDSR